MTHFDSEKISWYISTNGSALRQKHVDFFKQLKSPVAMGISHDGPGQVALRGEDIFQRPQVVDVLKQLDLLYPKFQYSFNPVVSNTNFNLFDINNYFYKLAVDNQLKNCKISFTLGRTYDDTDSKNSFEHVIHGENLEAFKVITEDYMNAALAQLKQHGKSKTLPILQSNIFDGETGAIKFAQSVKNETPITITTNCGADAEDILSVDLRGNARLCPHTHEKYNGGHISDIKGIKIVSLALDRKKTHCSDCQVRRLCKSSCPIDFPTDVFLKNCRVEKIWYGAVQNTAFKMLFGSDVELKETGIERV
jgi:radical SAM protein with 4Fe4S-binding SPASM domain